MHMNDFFSNVSGFPRFKSKYNPVQSYNTQNYNNSIRIVGNRIRLPKVGLIRFRTKQKNIRHHNKRNS